MQACSSAGYQDAGEAAPCSEELPMSLTVLVFFLLPGCNTPIKNNLGVQGVYVVFQVSAHHRGESGQEHEAETMGQHCSFTCAGSGSSKFLTQSPAYLLRDGCHPQWARLCYISERLRQSSTGRPTGQSDWSSSSIETSLVTLSCVKLTIKDSWKDRQIYTHTHYMKVGGRLRKKDFIEGDLL